MLEKLKRKSLKKLTEKNLANRDLSRVNSKVKTLGFLVDQMLFQDFDLLRGFAKDLELAHKDVKVFSFIDVKKKMPSLLQNQVQSRDFDWKGTINNSNAVEFLNRDLDVLVGLYDGQHDFMDVMMSQSKAKFKVGFAGADDRLYDLLIGVKTKDLPTFKKELVKYLKILGKI